MHLSISAQLAVWSARPPLRKMEGSQQPHHHLATWSIKSWSLVRATISSYCCCNSTIATVRSTRAVVTSPGNNGYGMASACGRTSSSSSSLLLSEHADSRVVSAVARRALSRYTQHRTAGHQKPARHHSRLPRIHRLLERGLPLLSNRHLPALSSAVPPYVPLSSTLPARSPEY